MPRQWWRQEGACFCASRVSSFPPLPPRQPSTPGGRPSAAATASRRAPPRRPREGRTATAGRRTTAGRAGRVARRGVVLAARAEPRVGTGRGGRRHHPQTQRGGGGVYPSKTTHTGGTRGGRRGEKRGGACPPLAVTGNGCNSRGAAARPARGPQTASSRPQYSVGAAPPRCGRTRRRVRHWPPVRHTPPRARQSRPGGTARTVGHTDGAHPAGERRDGRGRVAGEGSRPAATAVPGWRCRSPRPLPRLVAPTTAAARARA